MIVGVSDRIKKHLRSFNISTGFKPVNKLRGQLVRVKDKQPKDKCSNVVYGIKCGNQYCNDTYVGETKQGLKSRMNQHRKPSYGDTFDSAVFTHSEESGHSFSLDDVTILDTEKDWFRRGVKEAIMERVEKPSLNKRGGLRFNLSTSWNRAITKIPPKLRHGSRGHQVTHSTC